MGFPMTKDSKHWLMFCLFAILGLNLSWNPKSAEIRQRRAIAAENSLASNASRETAAEISLASEAGQATLKDFTFELNEYLQRKQDKKIRVEVFTTDDPHSSGKVRVDFRSFTEGVNVETQCPLCKIGNFTVPAAQAKESYLKLRVAQELENGTHTLSRPQGTSSLALNNCRQTDLSERLECLYRSTSELLRLCEEKNTVSCPDLIASLYKEKLRKPVADGLKTADGNTRYRASELRDLLIRSLPKSDQSANSQTIRRELTEKTQEGILAIAKERYESTVKSGGKQNTALAIARHFVAQEIKGPNGQGLCEALAGEGCRILFGENVQIDLSLMRQKAERSAALKNNPGLELFVNKLESPLQSWVNQPDSQAVAFRPSGGSAPSGTTSPGGVSRPEIPRHGKPGVRPCVGNQCQPGIFPTRPTVNNNHSVPGQVPTVRPPLPGQAPIGAHPGQAPIGGAYPGQIPQGYGTQFGKPMGFPGQVPGIIPGQTVPPVLPGQVPGLRPPLAQPRPY